jgi:predicted peptidase
MTIIPARLQEQVNRIDRTRSLWIGVSTGVTALWSLYRVFWLFYAATALSSVGYTGISLVFPLVLWSAIAVVAGLVSVAFLLRYSKQP